MAAISFEKYQGLGNDFILLDIYAQPALGLPTPEFIRGVCDRRFGVGADGVLLFSREADPNGVRMVYFNADGSRAETCFNGLRCIARHAVRTGMMQTGQRFTIQSDAAPVEAVIRPDGSVKTGMPGPSFAPADIPIAWSQEAIQQEFTFNGKRLTGTALSLGNPHFVIWEREKDSSGLNVIVTDLGAAVEKSPLFPRGTNFEAASLVGDHEVLMAVWERGVGVTMACGSGAAATVCAGVRAGFLSPDTPITVKMAGGEILIQVEPEFRKIAVTGDAIHVFSGSLDMSNLSFLA